MQLHEALGRISEIRGQLARTETFRDFRSLTVGFSGVLGIVAAFVQAQCIANPAERVADYVDLWGAVAAVNLLLVGAELAYRWRATSSSLNRRLITSVIQQFTPCLAAGAVVTAVVAMRAQEIAWILPGMWAIVFSLGVFACCRLLPPAIVWVGLHYLASGSISLLIGSGPFAFSPWLMVGTFGAGQLLTAGILYYTLERSHGD